jgi:hypothetical protein
VDHAGADLGRDDVRQPRDNRGCRCHWAAAAGRAGQRIREPLSVANAVLEGDADGIGAEAASELVPRALEIVPLGTHQRHIH